MYATLYVEDTVTDHCMSVGKGAMLTHHRPADTSLYMLE